MVEDAKQIASVLANMLTVEEIGRVVQLIQGVVPPTSGMEKHFLRVIHGEAPPCSPKEREWFEVVLAMRDGRCARFDTDGGRAVNAEADGVVARLRAEIAARDAVIAAQEKELVYWDNLGPAHAENVAQLQAKISLLEGFLSESHKALAKYEQLPPPLITDVQGENEKRMKGAEKLRLREAFELGRLLTKDIYSSIDGQD